VKFKYLLQEGEDSLRRRKITACALVFALVANLCYNLYLSVLPAFAETIDENAIVSQSNTVTNATYEASSSLTKVLDLKFENNINDSSPSNIAGTWSGAPATYVEGIIGKAISLNGTNNSIDLGTSSVLQPQNLTLSFWVKPDTAMTGEQMIAWFKPSGVWNGNGWYLSSLNDSVPLRLSTGTAAQETSVNGSRATFFPVGQWTHIMITYDDATKNVDIYRNGIKQAVSYNQQGGSIAANDTDHKYIGFNSPGYGFGYAKIKLDEFRIFSGVANAQDAVSAYQEGVPDFDGTEAAEAALDALSIPSSVTSSKLSLPKSSANGASIAWISSNEQVIAPDHNGWAVVTRPAIGSGDAAVMLTATASFAGALATRVFTVTVPALNGNPSGSDDGYYENVLSQSGMENVVFMDDYLRNSSQKNIVYLLSFDTDRLLVEFRKTAGLDTKGKSNYGGWEKGYGEGTRFTGHFIGHYISAISETYQANNASADEKVQLADKLKAMVDGIREAQLTYASANPANAGFLPVFRVSALPNGEDGLLVPFYNLHKIVQGLLDAYKWAPDQETRDKALAAASDFATFLVNWQEAKGMSKADMLRTEYGGMNEALYELFDYTGNPVHLKAAYNFDETALFQKLAANQDVLNGLHANTTIPKLTGALKRYVVLTENEEYYNQLTATEKNELETLYKAAAVNFWQMVIDHHTYINGDNSQSEHFHLPDELWHIATQSGSGSSGYNNNSTSETCNAHNMLKLTRLLFQITKDVKYSEYYEHTFINSILASQNPETGMVAYFQPMLAGYSKVFGIPYGEFWCDQGTGIENFAKLTDSFYFTDRNDVYVNMFWSSSFIDKRHNLKLLQTANVPKQDTVTFSIEQLDGAGILAGTNLKLRVPGWAVNGSVKLTVNGSEQAATPVNGWLTVPVSHGTQISYTLPAEVQVSDEPDNPNWLGFQYGPVVLAAPVGTSNVGDWYYGGVLVRMSKFDAEANAKAAIFPADGMSAQSWKANITQNLVRVDQPNDGHKLQFKLQNVSEATADLTFEPYYSLYQARYAIYLDLADVDSKPYQNQILANKRKLREELRTVDVLDSFDNNNSEFGKGLQTGGTSTVGALNGQTMRSALGPDGWFSYKFKVNKSAERNYLAVRYSTADTGNTFDIYVNGTKLRAETIYNTAGSNMLYWEYIEIPHALIQAAASVAGNDMIGEVTIRFQANSSSKVGGVYGVKTVTKTSFDTDPRLHSLTFDKGSISPAPFSPNKSRYVLTVPAGAESVTASITPAMPAAYVMVDGIVIDDTKPRNLLLKGDVTTYDIAAYAEDHSTIQYYGVTIVKAGAKAPEATAPKLLYTFDQDAAGGMTIKNSGTLGSTFDGVMVNQTASLSDDGNGGKALSLAGGSRTDDSIAPYVRIPAGLITPSQQDLTIAMRLKWDGNNNFIWPFAIGKDNSNYVFATPRSGSNLSYAEVAKAGAKTSLYHTAPQSANQWVDVAVVVEGGSYLAYYLDGKLVQKVPTTLTAADFIGTNSFSGYLAKSFYDDPYYGGLIDSFTVWDRALMAAELYATPDSPDGNISYELSISGPESVEFNQDFEVALRMDTEVHSIYGYDLTVNYDPSVVDFLGAEPMKEGVSVFTNTVSAGKVRLLISDFQPEAITANMLLLKLHFKAKELGNSTSSSVFLSDVILGDGAGIETPLNSTIAYHFELNDPLNPDLNGDGKISIGDLAMAAIHYGKTSSDSSWNVIKKADMNKDGKIDILDISALARMILE
jgi:uncharacterized protein